jgi:hypothetical protein
LQQGIMLDRRRAAAPTDVFLRNHVEAPGQSWDAGPLHHTTGCSGLAGGIHRHGIHGECSSKMKRRFSGKSAGWKSFSVASAPSCLNPLLH